MKPILIQHMQHEFTPVQRASLSAYDIVTVNSHDTHYPDALWRQIEQQTGGRLPAVIQTTWRGEPLRKLLISTYAPNRRHSDGRRVQVIKAVMCLNDPERWSGEWREWVCYPDLDVIEPGEPFDVRLVHHWRPEARR